MQLPALLNDLRQSLWFVPGLWVVGSGGAAFALIAVDRVTADFARQYPLIFGGGADGARSLLSAIATSMITVAGVTFSITIVVLQLTSTQFSPRVLRNFMRDRANQIVLGSFMGAFTYALLVLRSIRSPDSDGEGAFVPALAVTVGILLALVALAMLVFFVHHISTRIQASSITGSIAEETRDEIGRERHELERQQIKGEGSLAPPDGVPASVAASGSGYLQFVDVGELRKIATRLDAVIRLEAQLGDWVHDALPLFSVWHARPDDETRDALRSTVTLGRERLLQQDASFGLRQLADVAVKALSSGINDPTTARSCINHLVDLVLDFGRGPTLPSHHFDDDGVLRVMLPARSFDELLELAFGEIRHYGRDQPSVVHQLADGLAKLHAGLPSEHAESVRRQARLLMLASEELPLAEDRDRVRRALGDLTRPG